MNYYASIVIIQSRSQGGASKSVDLQNCNCDVKYS